jgi:hypothetical protein
MRRPNRRVHSGDYQTVADLKPVIAAEGTYWNIGDTVTVLNLPRRGGKIIKGSRLFVEGIAVIVGFSGFADRYRVRFENGAVCVRYVPWPGMRQRMTRPSPLRPALPPAIPARYAVRPSRNRTRNQPGEPSP